MYWTYFQKVLRQIKIEGKALSYFELHSIHFRSLPENELNETLNYLINKELIKLNHENKYALNNEKFEQIELVVGKPINFNNININQLESIIEEINRKSFSEVFDEGDFGENLLKNIKKKTDDRIEWIKVLKNNIELAFQNYTHNKNFEIEEGIELNVNTIRNLVNSGIPVYPIGLYNQNLVTDLKVFKALLKFHFDFLHHTNYYKKLIELLEEENQYIIKQKSDKGKIESFIIDFQLLCNGFKRIQNQSALSKLLNKNLPEEIDDAKWRVRNSKIIEIIENFIENKWDFAKKFLENVALQQISRSFNKWEQFYSVEKNSLNFDDETLKSIEIVNDVIKDSISEMNEKILKIYFPNIVIQINQIDLTQNSLIEEWEQKNLAIARLYEKNYEDSKKVVNDILAVSGKNDLSIEKYELTLRQIEQYIGFIMSAMSEEINLGVGLSNEYSTNQIKHFFDKWQGYLPKAIAYLQQYKLVISNTIERVKINEKKSQKGDLSLKELALKHYYLDTTSEQKIVDIDISRDRAFEIICEKNNKSKGSANTVQGNFNEFDKRKSASERGSFANKHSNIIISLEPFPKAHKLCQNECNLISINS